MKKLLFTIVVVFCLGWVAGTSYSSDTTVERPATSIIGNMLSFMKSPGVSDKSSPHDRISEDQIHVYGDRVVINIEDPEWATFTDTNSMDPILDAGANAIEIVPTSSDDIQVGDIVSYKSSYADGTIIHRVIRVGHDSEGWYAIMKGDNLGYEDPERVRFWQVQRVVVAIIY